MNKIKIHIGIIGYLPFEFSRKKISRWKSELFEVVKIDEYNICSKRSDTGDWGYTDSLLNRELPKRGAEDIFIGITYVPIQNNYYARRLEDNRIIVSLFGIHKGISNNNIPTENLLLRVMYSAILVFSQEQNMSPALQGRLELLHDDTRGCIFDMAGNKSDVIYSLNKPQLCNGCIKHLQDSKVSNNTIAIVNKELKRIKKGRYYVIESFVKRKPILSIIITFVAGVLMSIVANYIYDFINCLALKYL